MDMRFSIFSVVIASYAALVLAIPNSLVDEIKSSELRDNKVKRSHPDILNPEENGDVSGYFSKPTAIKRGTNLKNQNPDRLSLNEWETDQSAFRNPYNMDNIQSSLYNSPESPFDDKTISEYEKGFRYGTNKDQMDEALENAVLKSELYGEPGAINQYRYYGADEKRRRRRDANKLRLKREVELSPEEILALLSLYENNRQPQENENNYRQPWTRFGKNFDLNFDQDAPNLDRSEENWLETPVYPHATHENDIPNYAFDGNGQIYDKNGRWGGFADKKKRFMVAKKRSNDPTRMLRYLNGPNENDFNTLSKLLSNQRDPKINVPVYRRLVL